MDSNKAKQLVLHNFKNVTIETTYTGYIGKELVYAFIVDGKFILVYEDETVVEVTNPTVINAILPVLKEI